MNNTFPEKDFEFHIPYEEAIVREVYAHFGLASYLAQCFEKGLFNLVGVLLFDEKKDEWTKKSYGIELDRLECKTIAPLLKILRKKIEFSDAEMQLLETAHNRRNYLAHNFFWENAAKFLNEEGRRALISELSTLQGTFREADEISRKIVHQHCEKHGVTEEAIDKLMEEMVKGGFSN